MSKVSVVTGAGSGMGRALSTMMAENDHTVIAIVSCFIDSSSLLN